VSDSLTTTFVDAEKKKAALEAVEKDRELAYPMFDDLKDFALFTMSPEARRAFTVGWMSGFAAAHALVRAPLTPSPPPEADEEETPTKTETPFAKISDNARSYG
jgi:hypothetical protein